MSTFDVDKSDGDDASRSARRAADSSGHSSRDSTRDAARLRWLLTRPEDEAETTEPPMKFPRPDELADLERPIAQPKRGGFGRRTAALSVVCVGLVVAIGAYAGAGDLISDLFGAKRFVDTIPNVTTATVFIDSSMSEADSIEQLKQLASFGERPGDTIRRAPFGTGVVRTPVVTKKTVTGDTIPPKAAGASGDAINAQSEDANRAAPTAPSTKPDPVVRPVVARPTSTRRYVLQVRATPSRAEADQIASQLRARGAGGVTVTKADKDGKPVYRVRYGAFSDADVARASAARNGFSNAWVVAQ